jgi:hypothetical protein
MYNLYIAVVLFTGATTLCAANERPTDKCVFKPYTWGDLRNCYIVDRHNPAHANFYWVFVRYVAKMPKLQRRNVAVVVGSGFKGS